MIGPEIAGKTKVEPGYSWVPVSSANTTAGDTFYYAAWIREITQEGPTMKTPAVPKEEARPSIEFFKMAPMTLSALPHIFTQDIRWTIVISRYVFIAAIFLIAFYWARGTVPSAIWASIIGFWFVFYYDFVVVGAASGLSFDPWWAGLTQRYSDFFDVDYVMDRYRLVNPGVVTFITLLFFSTFLATLKNPGVIASVFAVLLGMVMAFNYPPHTAMGYITLFFLFVVTAIGKNYKAAVHFGIQGAILLLFLLLIDFKGLYNAALENTEFLGDIFLISIFEGKSFSLALFFQTMFSTDQKTNLIVWHIVSWVFAFFIFRHHPVWRPFVIAFGMLQVVFISALGVYDNPHLVGRLFIRGIDTIWGLPISIAFAYALCQFYKTRMMAGTVTAPLFCKTVGAAVIVCLLWAPAAGSLRFAERSYTLRQISTAQMDTYIWMENNLPSESTVLTASWEDVYMIPVYTDLNLFYGHWILDNRTTEDELNRYLLGRKFLGESKRDTFTRIDNAIGSYDHYAAASTGRANDNWITPPFVPSDVFESALVVHGIFYWPYVPNYKNIPLQNPDEPGKLNNALSQLIRKNYTELTMDEAWQRKFDYVLIPRHSDMDFKAAGFKKIFSNSYAAIYGKI